MPARAGEVAGSWCRRRFAETAGEDADIRQTLARLEDAEFFQECEVRGIEKGALRIAVRRPELLAAMRLRWHMELRAIFAAHARRARVQRIEFFCSRDTTAP
ncbi:MAG: hypothetical protein IT449_14475 [Phycisphaerales bacterium]|nr:hypothetical protein [Phycisphaerales bacterium]